MPYKIIPFQGIEVPIVVSVPHAGTDFPDDLKPVYHPSLIKRPDDTDWFVDQLYDFVSSMGITLIVAQYSRWVIDLNRDPNQRPLYTDGRIITDLCPTTTFLGEPLYLDDRTSIIPAEIERRKALYFNPYHRKLQALLDEKIKTFGNVLIWDSHSIRQHVPSIRTDIFPDLILGDADGTSADKDYSQITLDTLATSPYRITHNHPFKGGFITRHFGRPEKQQHALQLEMTKVNYMNSAERQYDIGKAKKMQELLKTVFEKLTEALLR